MEEPRLEEGSASPETDPPKQDISSPHLDLPVEGSQRQLVTETPDLDPKRRWLIPAAGLLLVAMLAVIIGLSVGLTNSKSSSSQTSPPAGTTTVTTCPIVPDGGCSVCGSNSCVVNPDRIAAVQGGSPSSVSCGQLQDTGYAGALSAYECTYYSSLIQEICGCTAAVTPAAAPTLSPADSASRLADIEAWIVQRQYSSEDSLKDPMSPQSYAAMYMAKSTTIQLPTDSTSTNATTWLQWYVLAVFYYALNGSGWSYQNSFLDSTALPCDWNAPVQFTGTNGYLLQGASCDGASGRVDTIQWCKYVYRRQHTEPVIVLGEKNQSLHQILPKMRSYSHSHFYDSTNSRK
jgi:hypothetical protein